MPSAAELRELHDEELEERLGEYRKELLNLRFQMATGQLDNPARLGQVRRDVARVLTLLRDREIALAEGRPVSADSESSLVAPRRPRRARARDEDEFETEAEAHEDDNAEGAAAADEDEASGTAGVDGEDE
jgi:large subunit ribosomal protein L29